MPKIVTHLLAAAAATLAVLTAAPAAHAGWVTGAGTPPAFQAAPVCRDGMVFHYATFLPDGSTSLSKLYLYDLQVSAPHDGPKDPPLLASADVVRIPLDPFYIDPMMIGGSIATWLPKRDGWFDYHAAIRLDFKAAADTQIQVRWRRAPGAPWSGNWRWTVEDCWL